MIIIALAAAAAAHTTPIDPKMLTPPKQAEPMPNFYVQPARCGPLHDEVTRGIRTATQGKIGAQYAVLRQMDGCGVPAPIGYHPDYLLPGAADAPPPKAPPR